MGRRIILLIAATAIAAVGTVLVYTYAKNADDRALEDQSPVTVVVAKTEIPAGTPVRQAAESGAFEQRDIPSATAIDGAMSSVEPIEEQVALTTLFPNQQLSTQMFGKTLAESSVLPIPPDNIAVSFQFTDPARVAGFVKPGSEVDCSWELFEALTHDEKLDLCREEIYVTALERILVPNDLRADTRRAYHWSLRRVLTSLFTGKWALFVALNLDELFVPNVDYRALHQENAHKLILLEDPQ